MQAYFGKRAPSWIQTRKRLGERRKRRPWGVGVRLEEKPVHAPKPTGRRIYSIASSKISITQEHTMHTENACTSCRLTQLRS